MTLWSSRYAISPLPGTLRRRSLLGKGVFLAALFGIGGDKLPPLADIVCRSGASAWLSITTHVGNISSDDVLDTMRTTAEPMRLQIVANQKKPT